MTPRRIILCVLAVVMVVLFVQPIESYLGAKRHLARAEVSMRAAEAQRAELQRELRDADSNAAMIRAARALGYVYPGETPYAIVGR